MSVNENRKKIKTIIDGIFEIKDDKIVEELTAIKCKSCNKISFPKKVICPYCKSLGDRREDICNNPPTPLLFYSSPPPSALFLLYHNFFLLASLVLFLIIFHKEFHHLLQCLALYNLGNL